MYWGLIDCRLWDGELVEDAVLVARSGLRGAWFLSFEGYEGRQKVFEPYLVGCWCVDCGVFHAVCCCAE